uniref:Uncharacterized protein n=1 Tax=Triticum urartu TaxID=4572 RepID=A0A8R7UUY6_TRIUA
MLRQVDAVPAKVLFGPRAHRRPRRAADPVHVEVVRAAARAAARLGRGRRVESHLGRPPEHLHVGREVVGVGDGRGRVELAQLPDALQQQHVVHLREEVEHHEAAVAVVRRPVRLVHGLEVARHAAEREVARDHHPRGAHVEQLLGRARDGLDDQRDEGQRLHRAGYHAPDVVEAAVGLRAVHGEGVVVVVPADLPDHDQ